MTPGELGPDVAVLVLTGDPDSLAQAQLKRVNGFFDRGGSALVLASGMELSPQMPLAMPKPVAWNASLERFGVSIRSDMVYDLLANEIVPVPSQVGRVLRQYPFFVRASSTGGSVINQEVSGAIFTWPSSIDTTGAPTRTITPLFTTSRAGGVSTGQTTIDPSRDYPQTDLDVRLLAVQAAAKKTAGDSGSAGRVVVIGDADFVSDRSAREHRKTWRWRSMRWIGSPRTRRSSALERKTGGRRRWCSRPSPCARESNDGNLIAIPLLVAIAGIARLAARRRKTRQPYRPLALAPERAA